MTYFLKVPAEMKPLLIGILGFDGVITLDLAGPLEALTAAKICDSEGTSQRCYETMLIGLTSKVFVAESGATFKTQKTLERSEERRVGKEYRSRRRPEKKERVR